MDTTLTPETSEVITILTFVLGGTQLVKDYGLVKGNWLQLVAVALGGFAAWLQVFHPAYWDNLTSILIALGVTGGVSFLKKR